MRALVSRALLLSPLVCGALVFGPVGTATAAVDAGRTASDRAATRAAAVPEPDLDAFFDALEKEIDALVEKEEAEADAIVDKEIADMEALFDKLDSDLDALLAGLDADTDAAAEAATGTATETDAVGTDVDDLLGQLDLLDSMDQNDVLAPLLDEMTAVAELDAGQLDTAEAARHVAALRTAHATVQQRLQKIDAAAPAGSHRAAAAADPVADLLAALQAAVDALLKALTSLDLGAVLGAVTGLLGPVLGVVTGLLQPVLGLVTGLLGGLLGGLPASTLPAIPAA
ncbi:MULTISPECIES: hypothetical protein [Streptomyces]|uniref:Uncharacterized protein n=1 Tax=Streptomyces caniscabiei TaxID=2746961 RepID=A0ABU4MMT4_9ACTN|nr:MULTISPECIES: hypothetical protein [Streptomyces]MBE4738475.1 hypothetical protein [Streptomyces caniscabiei]MBE4756728.1 hypothetical protein [Streptomyces caniscabiei]MBE4768767.1 hypothetical protein [Streptomyces caniscabiei]MBE4783099.1 hypothetical protein [Streptomyces caniscabiei]MBE4792403.1 hypothetical protein [Streptomyces caniscabiei]